MNKDTQSILLVEGTTDEWFIQSLLTYIVPPQNKTIDVQHIFLDKLYGSSENDLIKKLKSLKTDLRNKPIKQIGIILDKDEHSVSDRLALINNAILKAEIPVLPLTETVSQVNFDINSSRTISISYFIINDSQAKGNVETLLSEIITADPKSAECLKIWQDCSSTQGVIVKQSDYLKEWIKVYLRYDYCLQNKLQNHAGDYCTLEKSFENMNKESPANKAWDFDAAILKDLKSYLIGFL